MWKPVKTRTLYKVTKNNRDYLIFDQVKATAIKIKVRLNKDFSSGIYE